MQLGLSPRRCILFVLCLCGLQLGSAAGAEPARLTVDVSRPLHKVSPLLYGLFFEEINRAGDGGIYAEMVQNRSFEDADRPAAWSVVKSDGAEAQIALDTQHPLNPRNPHALRLEVSNTGGGHVGVANEGYRGMAVREGSQYLLSLYARSGNGFAGPLTASFQTSDGGLLAEQKIAGLTADWKKFECTLTARRTESAARLVVAASAAGTVWLDMVSLFPKDTYQGRANGLRADLMEMLAAAKPSFVRFPGGCYVEGDELKNAHRWKDTIGDIAQRPGHWNLWGYRSTDGLGYHEYLQMCEDLNAEPLFVINCGMAHKDHVPMDQMDPWVQDALDAIEYANGPADSQWGAQRVQNGHPAPFCLKYLEIGNENGGPLYQERYRLFYDAIKARYPDITLVADVRTDQRPTEIVDEHYYSSPEFFIGQASKYDKYDRSGPKVYVGEYAVTQGAGQGNLRAALGEAAFMTGMERNSDQVVMTSYAPLFVNVGWRQWNPDAIPFDSARVCGTPSYHVQAMFSQHRGDAVLPVELSSPAAEAAPPKGGTVGVGTWATQAEFKDLKVTRGDQVLYQSDFDKGDKGWQFINGEWQVQDGVLRQTSGETDCRALVRGQSWTDATLTLKARKLGGAEGFLILFRVHDPRGKSWWNIGGWGNDHHAIEMPAVIGDQVTGRIETNRWYDIRIELQGPRIRCYLDDKLIHDIAYPSFQSLYAVASRADKTGEVILKVVNVSAQPQDTEINLRGDAQIAKTATVVVLTSASPDDENSLDEPTKVAPATQTIDNAGPAFRHVFPAHSVTVLRIKAS